MKVVNGVLVPAIQAAGFLSEDRGGRMAEGYS